MHSQQRKPNRTPPNESARRRGSDRRTSMRLYGWSQLSIHLRHQIEHLGGQCACGGLEPNYTKEPEGVGGENETNE